MEEAATRRMKFNYTLLSIKYDSVILMMCSSASLASSLSAAAAVVNLNVNTFQISFLVRLVIIT